MITSGSTRGQKDEQGQWHFNYPSVAFSVKGHLKHKYAVGHKVHSLRTISGVPLVTILAPANKTDQEFILVLIEALVARYPNLEFSYIILDRRCVTDLQDKIKDFLREEQLMKKEKAFKIYGKILEKETKKGIPGLIVEALDKDLCFDDRLA